MAIGAFRGAIREWQATDAPYEAALAQVTLGEAYLAAGDHDSAASNSPPPGTFESLGAALDLARVRELCATDR